MFSWARRFFKAVIVLSLIVLSLVLFLSGCGVGSSGSSALKGKIKISGSTTLLPIAQEAAIEFSEKNPGVRIEVQGGGSSVGISQLRSRIVQIADSSRGLKGDEDDGTLVDHRIAFDIIVIVVNPDTPFRSISSTKVKDIFTGKIKNWKELGGPEKEIAVVVRDLASGTREIFDEKALGATKVKSVDSAPSAIECASNGVVREIVSSTKGAIGYLSYGYVDKTRVKPVMLNGISPNLENARVGRYPLARYLHMFTQGRPTGVTRNFVDFVLGDEFQKDVVSQEYIPVRLVERKGK
ncbi:MAG: phosphate ABC transporter substrate-binding protein [Actinomycetota bacterium]|nr:phosphate ABC transporter substrate-binding protein [Actinomycetota bacterium]